MYAGHRRPPWLQSRRFRCNLYRSTTKYYTALFTYDVTTLRRWYKLGSNALDGIDTYEYCTYKYKRFDGATLFDTLREYGTQLYLQKKLRLNVIFTVLYTTYNILTILGYTVHDCTSPRWYWTLQRVQYVV